MVESYAIIIAVSRSGEQAAVQAIKTIEPVSELKGKATTVEVAHWWSGASLSPSIIQSRERPWRSGRSLPGGGGLITPDLPGGWSAPPGSCAQVPGGWSAPPGSCPVRGRGPGVPTGVNSTYHLRHIWPRSNYCSVGLPTRSRTRPGHKLRRIQRCSRFRMWTFWRLSGDLWRTIRLQRCVTHCSAPTQAIAQLIKAVVHHPQCHGAKAATIAAIRAQSTFLSRSFVVIAHHYKLKLRLLGTKFRCIRLTLRLHLCHIRQGANVALACESRLRFNHSAGWLITVTRPRRCACRTDRLAIKTETALNPQADT